MNCDQFTVRMNELIDRHRAVDRASLLTGHSAVCRGCRSKIEAWRKIESVIDADAHSQLRVAEQVSPNRQVFRVAALAASLMLAVGWIRHQTVTDSREVSAAIEITPSTGLDVSDESRAAVQWLLSMHQRDWVAESMPTVRSVQEGVAPLGRSLMQAVAVLAVGGRGQAS